MLKKSKQNVNIRFTFEESYQTEKHLKKEGRWGRLVRIIRQVLRQETGVCFWLVEPKRQAEIADFVRKIRSFGNLGGCQFWHSS
jgi:hypothetical protein